MKRIPPLSICLLLVWIFSGCIHTYPNTEAEDPTLVDVRLRLKFPEGWEKMTHTYRNGERLATDPDLRIVVNVSSGGKNEGSFTTYVDRSSMKDGIDLTLPFKVTQQEHSLKIWADYSDTEENQGLCYDIADLSAIRYIHSHGVRKTFDDCFSASILWNPYEHVNDNGVGIEEVSLERPIARFRLVAQDYSEFIKIHEKEIRRGESYIVKVSYQNSLAENYSLFEDLPVDPRNGISFSTPLEIITIEGVEVELASDLLFTSQESSSTITDITVLNSALLPIASISGIEVPIERGKVTTVTGRLLTNLLSTGITIDNEWGDEFEIIIDNQENN